MLSQPVRVAPHPRQPIHTSTLAAITLAVLAAVSATATEITFTNAQGGSWHHASNWDPNQVPGSGDVVRISANTQVVIDGVAESGQLNIQQSAALTVTATGTFNIVGDLVLEAAALTNWGTVHWLAGRILMYENNAPCWIYNQPAGLFDIQGDGDVYGSYPNYFLNSGTLSKSAGTGITLFRGPFENTASVTAASGTITFSGGGNIGGSYYASSGAMITFAGGTFYVTQEPEFGGAGTSSCTGAALVLNAPMPGTNGFQVLSGSVSGTLSGTLNWAGASIPAQTALTIATNGVLNIVGDLVLEAAALTNWGTVHWLAGRILMYENNVPCWIYNQPAGLFDIQGDGDVYGSYPNYFLNSGTLSKSAGTGITLFRGPFENTASVTAASGTITFSGGGNIGGSYYASSGAMITFAGGTFYVTQEPEFGGAGTSSCTGAALVLNAPMPGTNGFQVLSGSVSGTLSGTLNWAGASIPAQTALTIATNGVLNIVGDLVLEAAALTNWGTVHWLAGRILMYENNVPCWIYNQPAGLFDIQGDGDVYGSYPNYFLNSGTLSKSAGTGITLFRGPFENTASVTAASGTITFSGGGTIGGSYYASSGAMITFAGGTFYVTQEPEFGGAGTSSCTGAALVLNAPMPGTNGFQVLSGSVSGTLSGTLNWAGASIPAQTALTIATNGVLNIVGDLVLEAAALTNWGTVHWLAGRILMYENNVPCWIYNQPAGLFDIQGDGDVYGSYPNYFLNSGTLSKSAGTGITLFRVPLQNAGLLEVASGSLRCTADFTLTPLSVISSVLGGANPGSADGQILIDGAATLAGTLAVRLTNNYAPTQGSTFTTLIAGTLSGTFANSSAGALGTGQPFQCIYRDNTVLLQAAPWLPCLAPSASLDSKGAFEFAFVNYPGASFIVLAATNLCQPPDTWTPLPGLTEPSPGQYQFTDPEATTSPQRFYRVRSP